LNNQNFREGILMSESKLNKMLDIAVFAEEVAGNIIPPFVLFQTFYKNLVNELIS
jgi:hypothetical protein